MLLTILRKNADNLINICTEEIEFGKTHRNPNNNKQKERKKGCHVAIRTWDGRGGEVIGLGGGSIFALLLLLLLPFSFAAVGGESFFLFVLLLFSRIYAKGGRPPRRGRRRKGALGEEEGVCHDSSSTSFFPFSKRRKRRKKSSLSPGRARGAKDGWRRKVGLWEEKRRRRDKICFTAS